MNDWKTIRKTAIVEADDFQDRWDRNGLNFLFEWKAKYPRFKITLFTIPDRTSKEFLRLIQIHDDWIELAMHGWNHESNFECYGWSYETALEYIERVESFDQYVKIFKAPGWTITPKYNGYPADPSLPLATDPTAVYRAMADKNFIVVDRHYNVPARPEGAPILCIDCNPDIIHMHTWNMPTGNLQEKNGFQQVEELHGVPWDNTTEFFFLSEAIKRGMLLPCQH